MVTRQVSSPSLTQTCSLSGSFVSFAVVSPLVFVVTTSTDAFLCVHRLRPPVLMARRAFAGSFLRSLLLPKPRQTGQTQRAVEHDVGKGDGFKR